MIISILILACHVQNNFFYIFPRHSNSIADLLVLVYLIIEACMKLKRIKISKDIAH